MCPVCRGSSSQHPLRISRADRGSDDDLIEGILVCPNAQCQREYPVIDGVPLIVPEIRGYVAQQSHALWARDDLGAAVESLLGDCAGPGSTAESFRQALSLYAWDHYAEFDRDEPPNSEPGPGGIARVLARGLDEAGPMGEGPVVDFGCSVGRSTFEIAGRTGGLVLGVDLNFAMLRLASSLARGGPVKYARRRVGLVYDRRTFEADLPRRDLVDFWACDAAALPVPDSTFAGAVSLNLLDAIPDPFGHLLTIGRVLRPGGRAVIGCPYDWSATATNLEGWIGGHSQRGPDEGASEPRVRALFAADSPPGLELLGEVDHIPWHVRLHDRASMQYGMHLMIAGRPQA